MSHSNKEITVAGYKYREYRGRGAAPDSLNPPSLPGDIYLDVSNPYRVFVRRQNEWVEWISMARTAEVPHPNLERILLPTVQRFSWVASSSIRYHTDTLVRRLGGRIDSAQTHVAIILNGENHSAIPKSIPKSKAIPVPVVQDVSSSLSDLSSMSLEDADPISTPHRRSSDSMMSIDGPPAVPFGDRCAAMRAENDRIRQLIKSSLRTSDNRNHNRRY